MKTSNCNKNSMKVINEGSVSSISTNTSSGSQNSRSYLPVGPGYKIINKIGSGNFGEIWLAKNAVSHEKVAVKMEKHRARSSQLASEYKIYRRFGSNKYMPVIYHYCQTNKFKAIVMELMGPNLEDIFKYNNNGFSVKSIILISIQILRIFEFIHSHGIIYRDVKPQNFVTGLSGQRSRSIFIVDFGLAKEYINPLTKSHIPYLESKNLTGTARYMSINTHLGREQSRRDDLESVAHMIIYFLRGSLPWQGLTVREGEDHCTKIGEVKRETPIELLCKDHNSVWATILSYTRSLDFYETPDYSFLINLLLNYYSDLNFTDENVDWDRFSSLSSRPSFNSGQNIDASDLRKYSNKLDEMNRLDNVPSLSEYRQSDNSKTVLLNKQKMNEERKQVYKSYYSRIELVKPNKSIWYYVKNTCSSIMTCFTCCISKKYHTNQGGFTLTTNC